MRVVPLADQAPSRGTTITGASPVCVARYPTVRCIGGLAFSVSVRNLDLGLSVEGFATEEPLGAEREALYQLVCDEIRHKCGGSRLGS
jgi:hypothetical protein